MSKTKMKPIKTVFNFNKTAPGELLARGTAVLAGVYADSSVYSLPPIDKATFKGVVDGYSSLITEALDGGKKAIAARNHQGEILIKMLRQLGHYVEAACNDDMRTFLASGFEARSTTKTPFQPLSQFIRKIDPGDNSGQFLVSLVAVSGAHSYELRWAPIGAGGTPGTWVSQPIGKTRPPLSVAGLTPGT